MLEVATKGVLHLHYDVVTSPAEAFAKHCDEYVCLSVCLSVREDISETTRAIFTNFFVHAARGSVLLRHVYDRPHCLSMGRVFFPIENALSARKGDGSAQRGRSTLSTIALFMLAANIMTKNHAMTKIN